MPRDPSGTYSTPVGTDGIPNFPIESSKYNINAHDVETDLNTPRPIIAGGTGANNATQALVNLSGETAAQLVTNYDSQLWSPGSFYSAAGATGAPVSGHAFAGICYVSDPLANPPANQNVVVEARDRSDTVFPGTRYVREKKAGVWVNGGAWTVDNDPRFVKKAGDVMSGGLTLSYVTPIVKLDKTADIQGCGIAGSFNNKTRWIIQTGDATAETGSNIGSNFNISRYDDTGAFLSVPFSIARNNGSATFGQSLTVNGGVTSTSGFTIGSANLINAACYLSPTNYAFTDGSNYFLRSAGIIFQNAAASATFGFFNSSGLNVTSAVTSSGYTGRQGVGGTASTSAMNTYWTGVVQQWVDATLIGNITTTSDYRIKKDVVDLPGMWDTVKALRPIKYTQAEFSPPSHVKHVAKEVVKSRLQAEENPDAAPREVATGPLFEADDVERWGFIAHELQETMIPSAASGVKDQDDAIQAPNPFTLMAALTKALQEAMARIEALEGAE